MNDYCGYIYLIQNIQNRKIYIGKTIQEPFKYIKNHFKEASNKKDLKRNIKGKYLYNAIRKYGKENFKIRILGEVIDRNAKNVNKKLNDAEIECIYFYRSYGSDGENCDQIYGYNQTKGGDGVDSTTLLYLYKNKLRPKKYNYTNPNKNKTFEELYGDEEAKKKRRNLSEKRIGRKRSTEELKKFSISMKENAKYNSNYGMRGKYQTPESNLKRSISCTG